eukprot:TRINITY_DN11598_c0_g1_i2.p1 TRINITY_DN11598_c0_g1~~TRINITY_DN11598_c0_g1_i2.p1  ORF type:complete len:892 (-),score=198.24 TRINITY_DN11598_c0_g1_i2:71-2746(-)
MPESSPSPAPGNARGLSKQSKALLDTDVKPNRRPTTPRPAGIGTPAGQGSADTSPRTRPGMSGEHDNPATPRRTTSTGPIVSARGGGPMSSAVKVCVRVRPFIKEELDGDRSEGKCALCIAMPSETQVQMLHMGPGYAHGNESTRSFDFDRCYWSHDKEHPLFANQETLMTELGNEMVQGAMSGFNNCIFAYGQTGSGKSYSVLGGPGPDRGLLPRVVEELFAQTSQCKDGTTCKTLVAFMEIYNEHVGDLLLHPEKGKEQEKLQVKQHPVLGVIIPGLTKAAVGSCGEVLQLVDFGSTMRHVSATAMNASSSRSHCIFSFELSISDAASGAVRMSHTHLVDLAGSERSRRTQATGTRLQEGNMINKSLSTLARVISELAKKNKGNPPFRDSKLTFILKESLCGNSRTVMMAAISPNSADYEETLSTLKFAQSAKKVRIDAKVNQVNEKGIEVELRNELQELKEQLKRFEQDKMLDQRRLSLQQRRLQEQEQLVAMYSSQQDWPRLLEEERKRRAARSALAPEAVEKLREKLRLKQDRSGDSDGSSSTNESDTSSGSATEEKDNIVLLRFHGLADATGSAIQSSIPSSMTLTGPAAGRVLQKGLGKVNARANELGTRLTEAREACDGAQKAANILSDKSRLRLRLRAMVTLDPDSLNTSIAIRCWRTSKIALEDSEALSRQLSARRVGLVGHQLSQSFFDKDEEETAVALITEEELHVRCAWLQEQLHEFTMAQLERHRDGGSADDEDDAPPFADAWEEAGKRVGLNASQGNEVIQTAFQAFAAAETRAAEQEARAKAAEYKLCKVEEDLARARMRIKTLEEERRMSTVLNSNLAVTPKGSRVGARSKAHDVALAIARTFDSALGAVDAAQLALESVGAELSSPSKQDGNT